MPKRPRKKKIDFDEVVSDSISGSKLETIERPLRSSTFYVVFFFALVVSLIFLGRSIFFSTIKYNEYIKKSEANINQTIPLIASRGIIVDRNSIPLVNNEVIFSVFLRIDEMIRNNEKEDVLQVASEVLGLDRDQVAKNIENTDIESITDIILVKDISRDQVIEIETRNLSSLLIENDYRREYIDPAFSHVIGYVGMVSKNDLRNDENLVLNDLIGRAGLEAFYDNILRGKNGKIAIYRNALGEVEKIQREAEPEPGNRLETTIDSALQKYFYNQMSEGLTSLGRTSGVGIAINPQNGEILALLSFPSFDANNINEYLDNKNQPLFNRAISGLYSPGSAIKPLHAIAALSEGVITPEQQIFSAGYIEIPNPYNPSNPSRFVDWKPQGWVNLYSALARSSNVYFYTIGGGFGDIKGLGINKLKEYWQRFGLDRKTGIDLPGEVVGFLPDPEEKEKRTGSIWRIGDTYNVSIGQGDFKITPIELLSVIASISNNGRVFTPHILKEDNAELLIDLSQLEPEIKEVRIGMENVVSKEYGTAHSLSDLPIKIAAKTGTPQTNDNTKINAIVVGYAPIENPQIAILVLVEDAREGSLNAIPIARDVFEWYYENRINKAN
jgi:penicillin-binding protein 2